MTTPSPYEPISYYTAEPPKPFAGWRTASIAFGVIAIVAGVLSAGMGLLALVPLLVARTLSVSAPRPGLLVSGALVYEAIAAALILLGVGEVRLRRWVRPLVLTAGTIAIVFGLFVLAATVASAPTMRNAMAAGVAPAGRPGAGAKPRPTPTPLPSGMYEVIIVFTLGIIFLLFILAPGLYVWFYRKPTVRQMLEYYDPVRRWTDACPLPVFGLAVGWAVAGVNALLAAPQGISACFGTVLFGAAAAGVQVAEAAVAGVMAWLAYRRRRAAWWGSLVLLVLYVVPTVVGLRRTDRVDLYREAGYTAEEVEAIRQFGATGGPVIAAMWVVGSLLALGYLLYVRRYFFGAAAAAPAGEATAPVPAEPVAPVAGTGATEQGDDWGR